ncbi:hypothetical protein JNUCC64_18240 [Streptomyces sp. JNUCC 64]
MGVETGALSARSRALAVLRVRGRATAVALLPAAAAVVLFAGQASGHLARGGGWDVARWVLTGTAVAVLVVAAGIGLVVTRSRPAVSPTVPVDEAAAPDLYRLVRELADRLDVPAPSEIALTPDCDSWLEDRAHRAQQPRTAESRTAGSGTAGSRDAGSRTTVQDPTAATRERGARKAPVLIIGSPFLWWMRVAELRAVLAPVVAGTGPSAHPDIAAARRFVRGLDAAVAVASDPDRGPLARCGLWVTGGVARLLLKSCRTHATEMERGVAAAAAERAQSVDYGLRIVAQEQVGLAYAGWDRLLTRVALPAWRIGRWPSRLDAGVVAALTELSRRDRLAEGFTARLGERPACDLLEEPGAVDEAASLLAARLFHGGPAETGRDWAPVDWQAYPEEVVDRTWRTEAARLQSVLDGAGARPGPEGPTLARVLDHLTTGEPTRTPPPPPQPSPSSSPSSARRSDAPSASPFPSATPSPLAEPPARIADPGALPPEPRPEPVPDPAAEPAQRPAAERPPRPTADPDPTPAPRPTADPSPSPAPRPTADPSPTPDPYASADQYSDADRYPDANPAPALDDEPLDDEALDAERLDDEDPDDEALDDEGRGTPQAGELAAALTARLAREEDAPPDGTGTGPAAGAKGAAGTGTAGGTGTGGETAASGGRSADEVLWNEGMSPLFPLQPPRSGRDLLAEHVLATVCCAAVDTAGAAPGLDWLDGPSLLLGGERVADLQSRVRALVDRGDATPLRHWLTDRNVRTDKPLRLV